MPTKVQIPKKLTMSAVKDIFYIITILLAVYFHFRDKAINKAVFEVTVNTMLENQKNIFEKIKEGDIKWEKQAEINGKITTYILLDTPK